MVRGYRWAVRARRVFRTAFVHVSSFLYTHAACQHGRVSKGQLAPVPSTARLWLPVCPLGPPACVVLAQTMARRCHLRRPRRVSSDHLSLSFVQTPRLLRDPPLQYTVVSRFTAPVLVLHALEQTNLTVGLGASPDSDDARAMPGTSSLPHPFCPPLLQIVARSTRTTPSPSDPARAEAGASHRHQHRTHAAARNRPASRARASAQSTASNPMALLVLRGCATPAVHAAPAAGSRLLPPPLRRRRLVAVASTASSAPSGEVASSSQHGREYGIVGGPNGNAVAPATATKSTVIETTVERVRLLTFDLLHRLSLASRVFYSTDLTPRAVAAAVLAAGDLRFPVPGTPRRRRVTRRLPPVLPQCKRSWISACAVPIHGCSCSNLTHSTRLGRCPQSCKIANSNWHSLLAAPVRKILAFLATVALSFLFDKHYPITE